MSQSQRQQRLRLLVRKLNKERKRQASQIDILCNDLIGAQRGFIQRLDDIAFAARFYKSLLGITDLRVLLTQADQVIEEGLPGADVTFFLRRSDGSGLGAFHADQAATIDGTPLEDYFPSELVEAICKSNRPCSFADLLALGLQGHVEELSQVSLATVPLNDLGRPLGFLLISRDMPSVLTGEELQRVALVTCGLSHAIVAARVPLHAGQ
ncbi:MAG: hypothetical protein RBR19_02940 [Sedimentisphaerales bacterium]|jgi:hypothetical protein|nr:hypothetical protein [Sedimentisphaerales bacterium]